MDTNNKYYTPSIEEFHIGFEYEWLNENGKWVKELTPKEITVNGFEEQSYGLRVKYLDKEDIESLGFVGIGTSIDNWYMMNKGYTRPLSSHKNRSISIQHDFRTNQGIVIRGFEYEYLKGEEEQLYRGECKNKSTLQLLMKQLGIQ